jgi:hypothetical protein
MEAAATGSNPSSEGSRTGARPESNLLARVLGQAGVAVNRLFEAGRAVSETTGAALDFLENAYHRNQIVRSHEKTALWQELDAIENSKNGPVDTNAGRAVTHRDRVKALWARYQALGDTGALVELSKLATSHYNDALSAEVRLGDAERQALLMKVSAAHREALSARREFDEKLERNLGVLAGYVPRFNRKDLTESAAQTQRHLAAAAEGQINQYFKLEAYAEIERTDAALGVPPPTIFTGRTVAQIEKLEKEITVGTADESVFIRQRAFATASAAIGLSDRALDHLRKAEAPFEDEKAGVKRTVIRSELISVYHELDLAGEASARVAAWAGQSASEEATPALVQEWIAVGAASLEAEAQDDAVLAFRTAQETTLRLPAETPEDELARLVAAEQVLGFGDSVRSNLSTGGADERLEDGMKALADDTTALLEETELPEAIQSLGWLSLARTAATSREALGLLDRAFALDVTNLDPAGRGALLSERAATLLSLRVKFPGQPVGADSIERRLGDYAQSWHDYLANEFECGAPSLTSEELAQQALHLSLFVDRLDRDNKHRGLDTDFRQLGSANNETLPGQLLLRALDRLPADGLTQTGTRLAAAEALMDSGYLVLARTVLDETTEADLKDQNVLIALTEEYGVLRGLMERESALNPEQAVVYESNLLDVTARRREIFRKIHVQSFIGNQNLSRYAHAMDLWESGRKEAAMEELATLRSKITPESDPLVAELIAAEFPAIEAGAAQRIHRTADTLLAFIHSQRDDRKAGLESYETPAIAADVVLDALKPMGTLENAPTARDLWLKKNFETDRRYASLEKTVRDVAAFVRNVDPARLPQNFEGALELYEEAHPEKKAEIRALNDFVADNELFDLIQRVDWVLDTDAQVRRAKGDLEGVLAHDTSWEHGDGSLTGGIYTATDTLSAEAASLEMKRSLGSFRYGIQYEELGGHIARDVFSLESAAIMVGTMGIGTVAGMGGRYAVTMAKASRTLRRMEKLTGTIGHLTEAAIFHAGLQFTPGHHNSFAATAIDLLPLRFIGPMAHWQGVGGSIGRSLAMSPMMTGTSIVRVKVDHALGGVGLSAEGEDPLETRQFLTSLLTDAVYSLGDGIGDHIHASRAEAKSAPKPDSKKTLTFADRAANGLVDGTLSLLDRGGRWLFPNASGEDALAVAGTSALSVRTPAPTSARPSGTPPPPPPRRDVEVKARTVAGDDYVLSVVDHGRREARVYHSGLSDFQSAKLLVPGESPAGPYRHDATDLVEMTFNLYRNVDEALAVMDGRQSPRSITLHLPLHEAALLGLRFDGQGVGSLPRGIEIVAEKPESASSSRAPRKTPPAPSPAPKPAPAPTSARRGHENMAVTPVAGETTARPETGTPPRGVQRQYVLFGPEAREGQTVVVGRGSRTLPAGYVGRVTIDDPVVSPNHFEADLHHLGLWIAPLNKTGSSIDLGSHYGTWVETSPNRWRIAKSQELVRPGQRIALGTVHESRMGETSATEDAIVLRLSQDGRSLITEPSSKKPTGHGRPEGVSAKPAASEAEGGVFGWVARQLGLSKMSSGFWQGFDAIGAFLFPNASSFGQPHLAMMMGADGSIPLRIDDGMSGAIVDDSGDHAANGPVTARDFHAGYVRRFLELAGIEATPEHFDQIGVFFLSASKSVRKLLDAYKAPNNPADLLHTLLAKDEATIARETGWSKADAAALKAEARRLDIELELIDSWYEELRAIERLTDPDERFRRDRQLSREILRQLDGSDTAAIRDPHLQFIVQVWQQNGEVAAFAGVVLDAYTHARVRNSRIYRIEDAYVGRLYEQHNEIYEVQTLITQTQLRNPMVAATREAGSSQAPALWDHRRLIELGAPELSFDPAAMRKTPREEAYRVQVQVGAGEDAAAVYARELRKNDLKRRIVSIKREGDELLCTVRTDDNQGVRPVRIKVKSVDNTKPFFDLEDYIGNRFANPQGTILRLRALRSVYDRGDAQTRAEIQNELRGLLSEAHYQEDRSLAAAMVNGRLEALVLSYE